jgi:DNA replication protein DnaC
MSQLREKARKLGLRTVVSNWDYYDRQDWLEPLLIAEEQERDKRTLEQRIRDAKIGQFKPIADFDWDWPERVDREQVEDLFNLDFLRDKSNVILIGTNGLGKTMIAQNLANMALL